MVVKVLGERVGTGEGLGERVGGVDDPGGEGGCWKAAKTMVRVTSLISVTSQSWVYYSPAPPQLVTPITRLHECWKTLEDII